MKTNITKTAKREYFTTEGNGMWHAYYQPLNPKTGIPWQASRGIVDGWNVWRGSNWKTRAESEIMRGHLPAFEEWSKNWTGVQAGFATEAEAVAAIQAEKARTGK